MRIYASCTVLRVHEEFIVLLACFQMFFWQSNFVSHCDAAFVFFSIQLDSLNPISIPFHTHIHAPLRVDCPEDITLSFCIFFVCYCLSSSLFQPGHGPRHQYPV